MRAILGMALGDVTHRRLQAAVVLVVTGLASSVAMLAIVLATQSSAPYDRAFEAYQGAHVSVYFNGSVVSAAQLSQTAGLREVAASAGPWPFLEIPFQHGSAKLVMRLVGRANPGGDVDRVQLVAGRWVERTGEVVVTRSFANVESVSLGDSLPSLNSPDRPPLTVVGEVVDIDQADATIMSPQNAWVVEDQVRALASPQQVAGYLMVYRLHDASTQAQIDSFTNELQRQLPPGALSAALSQQTIKTASNLTVSLVLTFLLAFAAFAIAAVTLVVANLVAGMVLASYRQIGVLKAVGFGPWHVLLVLEAEVLMPALAGCLLGVPAGIIASRPLADLSAEAIGLPTGSIDYVTPALIAGVGSLALVAVAAGLPAFRAALLNPVIAMAVGTAPPTGRRSLLGQLLRRAGLPAAINLGAGDAFIRPLRGILTAAGVLLGVATLTFAYGLQATTQRFTDDPGAWGKFNVTVTRYGAYPDSNVMSTLQAQPETVNVVAIASYGVAVEGQSGPVEASFMRGDSGRLAFKVLEGRWFSGAGEAVAGPAFAQAANLRVGDMFTVAYNGHEISLRLVGTYLDFSNLGRMIRMDWSNLPAALAPQPQKYLVELRSGSDAAAFSNRVAATATDFLSVQPRSGKNLPEITILNQVVAALSVVLVLVAAAGVLNTSLLNSRERLRDTAVFKVLGMTPRQVVAMVATSALVLGLVGGILGVPVGIGLHRELLQYMADLVGNKVAITDYGDVFLTPVVVGLPLIGVALAAIGAIVPVWRAARQTAASVLRAE